MVSRVEQSMLLLMKSRNNNENINLDPKSKIAGHEVDKNNRHKQKIIENE